MVPYSFKSADSRGGWREQVWAKGKIFFLMKIPFSIVELHFQCISPIKIKNKNKCVPLDSTSGLFPYCN